MSKSDEVKETLEEVVEKEIASSPIIESFAIEERCFRRLRRLLKKQVLRRLETQKN